MGQGRKEIEAYVGQSEPLHELSWLQVLKSASLTSPLLSSPGSLYRNIRNETLNPQGLRGSRSLDSQADHVSIDLFGATVDRRLASAQFAGPRGVRTCLRGQSLLVQSRMVGQPRWVPRRTEVEWRTGGPQGECFATRFFSQPQLLWKQVCFMILEQTILLFLQGY